MRIGLTTQKLTNFKPFFGILKKRFIAIDTETTGFSKSKDRIVEIGATLFENFVPVETFQTFVNTGKAIPSYSTNIHGITNSMIINAPCEDFAMKMFIDFLGDASSAHTIVVGHNFSFDIGFIDEALKRAGLKCSFMYFDTMYLSKTYLSLPDNKQTTVAKYFGLDIEGSHRADYDSLLCGKIFSNIINNFVK